MHTRLNPSLILLFTALVACTSVAIVVPLEATPEEQPRHEPLFKVSKPSSELKITEKFATVIELETRIKSVDGFDPEIVDVSALSPNRIRVQAVQTGVTTLVLEDEHGRTWSIDVFVSGDVRHLQAYLNQLFPQAAVEAVEVRDSVVLRGWVTQPEHITEMMEVAKEFYPKTLNQIKVGGVQQVQLHVKVLEVQRSRIRRLGMNFLYFDDNGYLASTPGSLSPLASLTANPGNAPSLGVAAAALSDSTLTFGLINPNSVFQGFIQALREEGLLKIMAEPTLTTTNGHPATLLNGGEFPILVPAGLGTVGVEFREFGVRMEVVPMILGEGRLRLELQPEVSERDFANAISVDGVTVPGLTVRRAQTQVEMRFGETLMIAGLISRRHTASTSKLPFLGELPWIGSAFSRKQFDEVETELVILVTPEFVAPIGPSRIPPGGPGLSTSAPVDRELFFDQMIEVPKYGDECEGCLPGMLPPTTHTLPPSAAPASGFRIPTDDPALIPPAPASQPSSPFDAPLYVPEKPSSPVNDPPAPLDSESGSTSSRDTNTIAPVGYRREYAFPGTESAPTSRNTRRTASSAESSQRSLRPRSGLVKPTTGLIPPTR